MKSTIIIIFCFVTGLIQAQFISRNENILKKSSELIYDDVQEAQRLLSFVNNNNSEKNHRVLSLLILSDAAYLKGDFVAVLNSVYQAEEMAKENAELQPLVSCYLAKYYRILGFDELSKKLSLRNSDLKKIPNAYNIKPHILLQKATVSESLKEKTKLLNAALSQIDSTTIFGNPLKYNIQLELAEVFMQRNLKDSAAFYLTTILQSGRTVFKARALIIRGKNSKNLNDFKYADFLLTETPDVISQLLIYKALAQENSQTPDKAQYKKKYLSS